MSTCASAVRPKVAAPRIGRGDQGPAQASEAQPVDPDYVPPTGGPLTSTVTTEVAKGYATTTTYDPARGRAPGLGA
ncbi:hypothetical protein ACFV2U_53810 [Streptomyces sp. NPDC059697]|uniref:hypothetical protein n=1 Tax=Streptomyces sp. NPDC059697 TaxID=3346912 RepID=UPI00369BAFA3